MDTIASGLFVYSFRNLLDGELTSESLWLNANQNATRYFTAPVTAGIYTYSVSLNGSQLCTATLELTDALTCAAPTTVNAGESFALTGTYSGTSCAKGWTHNLSGTGTEWPGELNCTSLSQNFTAPSTPGSYQYVMYVEGYPNANCTKTVTVEQVPPTFACPSNAKASIGASDNVKLALTGVTGCDEGGDNCNYSVTGDGNISVSGNSYTGGTLPVFTDNTVTSEDSKSYTVRLTNSAGSVEHDCSVEFSGVYGTCYFLLFPWLVLNLGGCSLLSELKNSSVYESLENQTLFQTSSGDSEKMAAEKGRNEKT